MKMYIIAVEFRYIDLNIIKLNVDIPIDIIIFVLFIALLIPCIKNNSGNIKINDRIKIIPYLFFTL